MANDTDDPLASPAEEALVAEIVPELGLRITGAPRTHTLELGRDLGPADITALADLPRGCKAPSLKRIHASHHALAKCLATGMRPNDAALVTGYSPGRISQLTSDPIFSALVADYRVEIRSEFTGYTERMVNMSLDAMELLHERLLDAPESFSIPTLLDVIRSFSDRTGYGPGQEVHLKVAPSDLIDRPPRETREEWERRRNQELAPPDPGPNGVKH